MAKDVDMKDVDFALTDEKEEKAALLNLVCAELTTIVQAVPAVDLRALSRVQYGTIKRKITGALFFLLFSSFVFIMMIHTKINSLNDRTEFHRSTVDNFCCLPSDILTLPQAALCKRLLCDITFLNQFSRESEICRVIRISA